MTASSASPGEGRQGLRLVADDDLGMKAVELPAIDNDSAGYRGMRERIRELEGQVRSLQRQLEVERRHALIDPLTGIANRRALVERLKAEIARSQRNATPLSLVVWDIDHFKAINDRYGHPFGDDVIRCVAQAIDSHLRDSDFTARYGGEEFVSLLPDCSAGDAKCLAGKICRVIQERGCRLSDISLGLTISCGIASLHGNETAEMLFKRADDALYRAKTTGRNRVVVEFEA
ncbi:MAG: GGDEF domain-containing protein [Candidatus Thiodiazotropha sp.]